MSEMEQEDVTEASEDGEDQQGGDLGGLSIEEQASLAGWKPDHPGGKSAEEFLARNSEHKGLMRKENERLYTEIGEMKGTITAMAKHLELAQQRAHEQGYKRAIEERKAQMRQAVEDADREAFDKAATDIERLEKQRDETRPEPIHKEEKANPLLQEIAKHQEAHPEIFETHAQTQEWMAELYHQGKDRGKSFEEARAIADKMIVRKYGLQRSMPGPSDGDSSASGAVSSFKQLPKEAQLAYEKFAKEIPGYTKEDYLATYNTQF